MRDYFLIEPSLEVYGLFLASLALIFCFPLCHRVIVIPPDGRRGKTKGIIVTVRFVVTFYPQNKCFFELLPCGSIYWSNDTEVAPGHIRQSCGSVLVGRWGPGVRANIICSVLW